MRPVPPDEPDGVGYATAPQSFWQRLAQSLDAFVLHRTKHAVPEAALRRSRYEIKRCRRLMLAAAPAELAAAHAPSRRVRQTTGAQS